MAGGMTGGRRPRLSERTDPGRVAAAARAAARADPPSSDGFDGDLQARPCWVAVGGRAVTGTVHAWRRAPDGSWEALVVAWVSSDAVRPRTP